MSTGSVTVPSEVSDRAQQLIRSKSYHDAIVALMVAAGAADDGKARVPADSLLDTAHKKYASTRRLALLCRRPPLRASPPLPIFFVGGRRDE